MDRAEDRIESIRAELSELADDTRFPEVRERIEELRTELQEIELQHQIDALLPKLYEDEATRLNAAQIAITPKLMTMALARDPGFFVAYADSYRASMVQLAKDRITYGEGE